MRTGGSPILWRFPEVMGDLKVTTGLNTKTWSNLDDWMILGAAPFLDTHMTEDDGYLI